MRCKKLTFVCVELWLNIADVSLHCTDTNIPAHVTYVLMYHKLDWPNHYYSKYSNKSQWKNSLRSYK